MELTPIIKSTAGSRTRIEVYAETPVGVGTVRPQCHGRILAVAGRTVAPMFSELPAATVVRMAVECKGEGAA